MVQFYLSPIKVVIMDLSVTLSFLILRNREFMNIVNNWQFSTIIIANMSTFQLFVTTKYHIHDFNWDVGNECLINYIYPRLQQINRYQLKCQNNPEQSALPPLHLSRWKLYWWAARFAERLFPGIGQNYQNFWSALLPWFLLLNRFPRMSAGIFLGLRIKKNREAYQKRLVTDSFLIDFPSKPYRCSYSVVTVHVFRVQRFKVPFSFPV